jgi:hypothetical protein
LSTNGVQRLPDPEDWDPKALQQFLCLPTGEHVPTIRRGETVPVPTRVLSKLDCAASPQTDATWEARPDFTDVAHFFAWRHLCWNSAYSQLSIDPDHCLQDLEAAVQPRPRMPKPSATRAPVRFL